MPSLCSSLKSEYESLQILTQEFVSSCAKAGDPRALSADQLRTLQIKKQALEHARDALKEKLNIVIHVPNATNPYREALLASGIPNIENNPLSKERIDITLNIKETIKQQQEIYKSMGLTTWAENIGTMRIRLTPEKRRTIEQEIKDGAIPIVMPDRKTQLNTTVEQFKTSFKPTWIKEGEEQQVNDALFDDDHFKNLLTTKAQELVEGVPDHPYLSMMCPTQRPNERTTDKTVFEQQNEFIRINEERATVNQQPANIQNPHEYGALQTVHSRLLKQMMSDQSTTLNPIDSNTWIRFINLPLTRDRSVPNAFFNPNGALAVFDGFNSGSHYAESGFRLAVRVEL